jgi:hypothetical protein
VKVRDPAALLSVLFTATAAGAAAGAVAITALSTAGAAAASAGGFIANAGFAAGAATRPTAWFAFAAGATAFAAGSEIKGGARFAEFRFFFAATNRFGIG